MSTPTKIDHVELALSRLPEQWQGKPVTKGLVESWLKSFQEVEDVFFQLLTERNIDNGVGAQLDVIGYLVGQPRYVVNGSYAKYFGFLGSPNGVGFNTAPWIASGDPLLANKDLDDEEYRLYLKARAASNGSSGTGEDLIQFFKNLFGNTVNTGVTQNGVANADVLVVHRFTPEELLIVLSDSDNRLIPRAAGVSYTIKDAPDAGYFGFQGNPTAAGFNTGGFVRSIGTI